MPLYKLFIDMALILLPIGLLIFVCSGVVMAFTDNNFTGRNNVLKVHYSGLGISILSLISMLMAIATMTI